ncbi:MAG: metalloregulator ArsR/SmtB family transcription factor [Aliifodinibius sp.]|nr:metalloregulator ArsR/SmtB family transcription factor [Fodinibius sp.]
MISDHQSAALAELFRAFSDASRIKIISSLVEGERNVSTIAQTVGLSESATSHHLRGLRQMQLVQTRKEGRQVFYSLIDEHVLQIFQIGKEHILHG